MENFEGA